MNFRYYFRHMASSEALIFDFEKKMSTGMEGMIHTSHPIHVTFSVDGDQHKVHVGLHAKSHQLIEVEEVSDDMHKSIDYVMDTLHRKLSREKDKLTKHTHKSDQFEAFQKKGSEEPADAFIDEEFAQNP